MNRGLSILGSTGSVGVSALEVVGAFPERFTVLALAAGRNIELLSRQAQRFRPELISVSREQDRQRLVEMLRASGLGQVEVLCGDEGAAAVACHPGATIVLSAMVGAVGLQPTLKAIERGVTVAISNKESLVIAGKLCLEAARDSGSTVIPVDSEHSAIYQCLAGHRQQDVHRIYLTGSGGPLYGSSDDPSGVTPEQALSHPTWSMGPKISVDSATLMNKGLEVIEARWLFNMPPDRIQVVIHPQSIVHSLVEYVDGVVVAQLALPDMRIPIGYALGYPDRLLLQTPRLELTRLDRLTFEPVDPQRFRCIALAYQVLDRGGTFPAVLNAANEVAVEAFLEQRIRFMDIPRIIEQTLDAHQDQSGESLEELLAADGWARQQARSFITTGSLLV